MSYQPVVRVLCLAVVAVGAAVLEGQGTPRPDADAGRREAAPVRLIVQNRSYSTFRVFMREQGGRARSPAQAPPELTTTWFTSGPGPGGPAPLGARPPGQSDD